jgi:hypothetical protein
MHSSKRSCGSRSPCSVGTSFISSKRSRTTTASKLAERIDYRRYRLEVGPAGKGWRAAIYVPGSASPLPESPATLGKSSEDEIVAEAKRIIDERLNK